MSVSDYRGYVKVHLRNFINDPVSGKKFPMKTGITLSLQEWEGLKMQMQGIQEIVKVTFSLMSESKRQAIATDANVDGCERQTNQAAERFAQNSYRVNQDYQPRQHFSQDNLGECRNNLPTHQCHADQETIYRLVDKKFKHHKL